MRNNKVIELFSQREEASNQYLKSDGDRLYADNTCIAEWDYPVLYINYDEEYIDYTNTLCDIVDDGIWVLPLYNVPVGACELIDKKYKQQ